MEQITKAILPFIFVEIIVLFLITFIPDSVLFTYP
jgi:TRAP-type C4-dicarboxylate transport system permease large subunit